MEELSKFLNEALEDKISLSDQDNNFQSSKLARRPLRKRRGRKRRLDHNPIWEFSVVISDQSDTSLDEALKDYMENVTDKKGGKNNSANEDHMLKKLSSLNVTSSSNLYGESDSVPEGNQIPKKASRKKKSRPKRMSVDGGTQSCIVTRSSSLPDFTPQIKKKKQRLKKSQKKEQNENNEVTCYKTIEDQFGNRKKVANGGKMSVNSIAFSKMDIDVNKCCTSSPEGAGSGQYQSTESHLSESRTQSSSSDGTMCTSTSSKTDDRADNMISGDDDTSETLLGREASESNESSEDDGLFTNDEGREADDEQSDFFHEPEGPVAGIPRVIPWWEKSHQNAEDEKRFYKILNGAIPLLNKGSQMSFNSRLRNLQNRFDDCSHLRSLRSRFKQKRLRKANNPGQLNDRVVRFLKKPHENEIDLHTLRTKQPPPMGRFTSIYSLDIQSNTKAFLKNPALCGAAANNDMYMASSSTETDCLPKSTRPQIIDVKRRRKSPRKTGNDGKVIGAAAPIPESNVGNQMLQNMGWKPGTGLGAMGRGMKEPVQVFIRPKNRGLGHWKPS